MLSQPVLAIGGCFALLGASERVLSVLSDLPYVASPSRGLFETKVLEDLMRLFNSEHERLASMADGWWRVRPEIVFSALPVDDPQVRQPDITRAKQLLGWQPEVELEEGLKRTIAALEQESPVGSS